MRSLYTVLMAASASAMSSAGIDSLVALLDREASKPDVEATVEGIKSGLCRLIRADELALPAVCLETVPGRYARRLLHRNDALGYSVVVMTWGPGQGTPVHDHAGMWCVEGVCAGHIEVQQYELTAREGERFHFEKRNSYHAGIASAGCLIPPYEYHRIENADDLEVAVSIHIYGGDMTRCNVFEAVGGDWYRPSERRLTLD